MQRRHVQNQLKNLLDNVHPNGEVEEEDLDELVSDNHLILSLALSDASLIAGES